MDSFSEVRRVRKAMSATAVHDIRKLAAMFNARRAEVADRIIDPGTKAEQCVARGAAVDAEDQIENRLPPSGDRQRYPLELALALELCRQCAGTVSR